MTNQNDELTKIAATYQADNGMTDEGMATKVIDLERIARNVPDRILTYEAEYELRYGRGIDVPQTPFSIWDLAAFSMEAYLYQFETASLIVGTVSHDEERTMREMLKTARRFRARDYAKSKLALLQWLKAEGVTVTPEMLEA